MISKLQPIAWIWFIGTNGGLNTCLLSLKRHNEMRYNVAQVMEQFGKDHYFDLFTEKIKIMLQSPQDYLKVISDVMDPLFTNESSRQ